MAAARRVQLRGPALLLLLLLLLLGAAGPGVRAARSRGADRQNSLRRAASGLYQGVSGLFGEDNVRALQKFFSRLTERFVNGVDVLMDTFWRIWTDLLDVLGIDASNLTHYFSPAAIANNPTRALLLIGAILLAYWFLSLFLGFFFYLLHMLFGRFFWIARVALFTLSCVYILQKYEGDPEHAVLPLCFVVAVYFMTGPVGFYWRRNSNSSLEEKMDHLDSQIRLLNIRLSRVIENLDRGAEQ
ncbi:BRI3-binding protein [Zonotrichia leucophrys gambelii]|uniref:BRI3-binding protein n=1 Tax=Zonotrichia leucophrys gambelii TaxID=257770 RepID=UPI003140623A